MNLRYISLLLLLVFVAGIGAISAEDISDIGEISSDEVADEVISVDDSVTDVSTSDADEVTSDVEPTRSTTYTWGDFKSEVEDTSVNTVKLNQSNIAPSSDSSDQISINHDITIVGGYGYYIGNADWNSAESYKNSDILSFTNDEFLTDSFNHVYVSVDGTGDGSSADNPTSLTNAITANIADNTIVHIADGNYEVTTPVTIKAKENISIMADNPGKVNISYNTNRKIYLTLQAINNFTVSGINFNYTYTLMTFAGANVGTGQNAKFIHSTNILIDKCNFDGNDIKTNAIFSSINPCRNLTISNCNFSNSNARFLSINTNIVDYSQRGVSYVFGECVVNIANCIFSNCSTDAVYLADVKDKDNSPNSIIKHYITNCKFYNTSLTIGVGNQVNTESIYEIKDCIFDIDEGPSIKNTGLSNTFGGIFTFENNNINSDYAIQLGDNSRIISPLTFRILNNESIKVPVNESVDIIGELVDDKGNRIYHAGLKLKVNESELTPVINSTTGLYVLSLTPENIGELPIEVKCDNIAELNSDIFYLTVKGNPDLVVNCSDACYGEIFKVNATLKEDVSSENVIFTIFDSNGGIVKTAEGKIDNGFASAEFESLIVGEYIVEATFIEDDKYASSSKTMSFNINQANATGNLFVLNDDGVYVGDRIIVQAVLPTNATGSVTFRLEGTQQIIAVSGEIATALFAGLSEGEYTVYAIYSGDSNYKASEEFNTTFNVVKKDVDFYVDASWVSLGDDAEIDVYDLPDDATGTITYYVNSFDPEVCDVDETLTLSDLPIGKYSVRAVYSGDDKYNGGEATCEFEVYYDIELENDEFAYGDDALINITFPDELNGNLGVIVDGNASSAIAASVVNGSAVFTLSNLTVGEHTLDLTYQGEKSFETTASITVGPKISSLDDLTTGDNTITLNLPSDATGNMTICVDDNDPIVVKVVNGTAKYDLNNLSAGDHEISVAYEGNYPSFNTYKDVSVAKATPTASVNAPSSITAGQTVTIPINLPSDATGVVLVDVDGKKYYADVAKGVASVAVAGLTAGNKVLTYKYLGDSKYAASTGSATLKVVAPKAADKITLTLKKVTVKRSAKKLVIKATLKINGKVVKGKKVTFKFKGKKYTAKTNAKGVAKITVKKSVLKKLKKGKKVTYTATYGKTTAKKTVKVKK